jgi:hypothetical protein
MPPLFRVGNLQTVIRVICVSIRRACIAGRHRLDLGLSSIGGRFTTHFQALTHGR